VPRNSRANADPRAKEVLASAIAEFEDAYPEPRTEERDDILKRLKAIKDVATVHAFARVYDECELIIDRMVEAAEIQIGTKAPDYYGAKEYRDEVLVILKKAQAALPNMIEAAQLIARWDPDNDHTKCLQKLERSLEFQSDHIEHSLSIMSPRRSHRNAWALHYLVRIVDFEGESGQARTTDLARLASVAFGLEITDKMVSTARSKPM
jgi:hypothetical protein